MTAPTGRELLRALLTDTLEMLNENEAIKEELQSKDEWLLLTCKALEAARGAIIQREKLDVADVEKILRQIDTALAGV